MSIPNDLAGQMADLYRRIAELDRRGRNRKRSGTIKELDLAKGLARVEFEPGQGEDGGKPYVGPWMPWKEIAAGGIKTHFAKSIGEQVDVLSESGELSDGVIDMSTPSNANPRPHDGPEAVLTYGGTKLLIADGTVTITADLVVEGSLSINGTSVEHNGTNIGDSHVHGGVISGGDDTATPH